MLSLGVGDVQGRVLQHSFDKRGPTRKVLGSAEESARKPNLVWEFPYEETTPNVLIWRTEVALGDHAALASAFVGRSRIEARTRVPLTLEAQALTSPETEDK